MGWGVVCFRGGRGGYYYFVVYSQSGSISDNPM